MEGIHEAASQPGGTSADVWTGWNQAEHPVYGKTGTAEHAGQEDQSWYMCYIGDPKRPIVIAVTVEAGRLRRRNGRADRAPDRLAVVRPAREVRRRDARRHSELAQPDPGARQSRRRRPVRRARDVGAQRSRLPLDPLLTLAVIGLGICSVVTLGAATRDLVPGDPGYYVDRQAVYLVSGCC